MCGEVGSILGVEEEWWGYRAFLEPSGSNEECRGGPPTFIKASGRTTLSSAAGDNACSPAQEGRRWWITSKSRDKTVISAARIQTEEETGEYHTPTWKNHTKATSYVFHLSDLASESAAGVWTQMCQWSLETSAVTDLKGRSLLLETKNESMGLSDMARIKGQWSVPRSTAELHFQIHQWFVRRTQPLLTPQVVSHTCEHAEWIEPQERCFRLLLTPKCFSPRIASVGEWKVITKNGEKRGCNHFKKVEFYKLFPYKQVYHHDSWILAYSLPLANIRTLLTSDMWWTNRTVC